MRCSPTCRTCGRLGPTSRRRSRRRSRLPSTTCSTRSRTSRATRQWPKLDPAWRTPCSTSTRRGRTRSTRSTARQARDRWPYVPSREARAVKAEHGDLLRKLALNEEGVLASLLGTELVEGEPVGLDAKTTALVRLAGLIAVGSAPASYQWCVTTALAAGASDAEVV